MEKYLRLLSDDDMDYTGDMDRIFTKLTLDDYDWIRYCLEVVFPLKNDPPLYVKFEYTGSLFCALILSTFYDSDKDDIEIRFNSEIFERYLTKYLETHLASRENPIAFYGGDIALELWNEVLSNKDTSIKASDTTGYFEKLGQLFNRS